MSNMDDKRFNFGKNWDQYIRKNFNEDVLQTSKSHILDFLNKNDLNGVTFIDIGCGSGLHSLAALEAGAEYVHSFDYDPYSVKAAKYLRAKFSRQDNWKIEQGSILDSEYINNLPKFDIVYSWGVLHHTGDVWKAIQNAASLVKPGGLFYIALYSADVQIDPTPEFWLDIKQRYVSTNWFVRRYMELWYIWRFMMQSELKKFPEFLERMREYNKTRGMNIFTDIRDWLGGWPMEFVYDKEATDFCEKLNFELLKIKSGEANTEFLFKLKDGKQIS